jgi:hypothetical protein
MSRCNAHVASAATVRYSIMKSMYVSILQQHSCVKSTHFLVSLTTTPPCFIQYSASSSEDPRCHDQKTCRTRRILRGSTVSRCCYSGTIHKTFETIRCSLLLAPSSQEDYSDIDTLESRFSRLIGFLQNAATGQQVPRQADSCEGCTTNNQNPVIDTSACSLEASLKRLRLVS